MVEIEAELEVLHPRHFWRLPLVVLQLGRVLWLLLMVRQQPQNVVVPWQGNTLWVFHFEHPLLPQEIL